ncbi:MAG TPA: competence/damage-inducible protein A [Desulfotomaculum sp.]|jgi:nicotinamide-nucleotide amidase|nr:competence/damage-inducible protein A [Desulfotomaculum sp.]
MPESDDRRLFSGRWSILRAELIFTGTELLLGQILNTNAQYLQQVLTSLGINIYYQVTVGDNLNRLSEAITQASGRANLIIISGGLGPTEDDLSREALAKSAGVSLVINEQALKIVRYLFEKRNLPMPDNNLKQALVPAGGIVLNNPIGTAPGVILEHKEKIYVLIPGPPSEFRLMVNEEIAPYLHQKLGNRRKIIKSRVLKLCGLGESMADERLGELLRSANPTLAPTARFAEVHLRITSKADSMEDAIQMNTEMEAKIRQRVGEYIFGTDEETLAEAVSKTFIKHNLTLTTMEAFTGGLLAYQLATAPGSEKFYKGGYVLGTNRKIWPENILVSAPTSKEQAEQLAFQGQTMAKTDACAAVTGQMNNGIEGKSRPGGTVYIATNIHGKNRVGEFNLWGMPSDVRERGVQVALSLLWRIG